MKGGAYNSFQSFSFRTLFIIAVMTHQSKCVTFYTFNVDNDSTEDFGKFLFSTDAVSLSVERPLVAVALGSKSR
jgi:hypothetical protein